MFVRRYNSSPPCSLVTLSARRRSASLKSFSELCGSVVFCETCIWRLYRRAFPGRRFGHSCVNLAVKSLTHGMDHGVSDNTEGLRPPGRVIFDTGINLRFFVVKCVVKRSYLASIQTLTRLL